MPLIVLCGTPLSGKSTRAQQLQSYFVNNSTSNCSYKCVLISDEEKLSDLGLYEIYNKSQKEKELRSWLKSEVQRNLSSPDTLVILDAANYIKGYRYELYCLSKQFKTTFILIECLPSLSRNKFLNNNSETEDKDKRTYSREIFDELLQRYEPPNSMNRWENPLFQIDFYDKHLPFEEVEAAIFKVPSLKPNRSTQALPMTTDNFLLELDNQTQNVVKKIQSALQLNQLKNIKIKGTSVMVNLNRKIPIAELNKYRRQFINYTRLNPINDKDRIITAFVQFINNGYNC